MSKLMKLETLIGVGLFLIALYMFSGIFMVNNDAERIASEDTTPIEEINELNKPAAVLVNGDYLWIADLGNHQIKILRID